ncbi:MAG: helix-turn-helix domain-containing protein [Paracoccaceae bacterium]|nr:helix-turn-helix domain-containing protein [Paracoccaceae bacterium]
MYVTLPDNFTADASISVEAPKIRPDASLRAMRKIADGEALFFEGDDAAQIYEVVTGVVRLSRVTRGGRRQVIAFGFPGDVLGFPVGGRYHTDCDVLQAGTVVTYPVRVLDACTDAPELHRYLVRAAMSELGGMQDHFMVLGRKCASERIAAFLSVLAARTGTPCPEGTRVRLPMFRSDIADFLGLSSETISRTFTRLREDGVIDLITTKDILVRDAAALRALSETEG